MYKKPTANSYGKFPRQIPTAYFQTYNAENGVENPLCGRAHAWSKIKTIKKAKVY